MPLRRSNEGDPCGTLKVRYVRYCIGTKVVVFEIRLKQAWNNTRSEIKFSVKSSQIRLIQSSVSA